ncbi:MAG: molybdopterin-containing oxidoreductase family protein [Pseudomonadota bacterium]
MTTTKYLTTCPLDCFDCCSIVATVGESGELLKLEGNGEHPITKGFICEKGRKHLERVHHPARLKYPMRKINNEWQRISWDEALGLISDKMKQYMSEYGHKSICLYSYSGSAGLLKNIEDLFFDYIGGTTKIYGSICWGAGTAAQQLDFGKAMGHNPEDMENSKTVIIWGRNPAETNIHLMSYLKKASARGAELILIDPLKTATAGICNRYIRVKSEGDAALACAIAKHAIETGSYASDFVESCTAGHEEIIKYLKSKSMEELSELSGVSAEDIALLAGKLTKNKPAAIYIGYGLQRYPYGGAAVRCIDMLAAITGNIGIAGGGANYSNGASSGCLDTNPFGVTDTGARLINRAGFGRTVRALSEPPIKLLFISRANPVVQLPNTNDVISAMESIEFKVTLEHFMTDTAKLSDLVLPVTYFLEEEDAVVPGMWSHYVGRIGKCVDKYHEARHELEIYNELAERLGIDEFPRLTGEEWLQLILRPLVDKGLKLDELKEKGFTRNPVSVDIPWNDRQFATVTGKFEMIKIDELKKCIESSRGPDNYKYRLIFAHTRKSLHSQHMLDAGEMLPAVYISPEDAEAEKVIAGEKVELSNNIGSIEAIVEISRATGRHTLYVEEGWWLANGGGMNRLTADGVSDIGNQGIMNHCFCDMRKTRGI